MGIQKGNRIGSVYKNSILESLKQYFLNRELLISAANSNFILKKSVHDYSLKNPKTTVVHNGIKIPDPLPAFEIQAKGKSLLGLYRDLLKGKSIDRLIHAFHEFLKMGWPGKIILVGDGDTMPDLESLVKDLDCRIIRNLLATGLMLTIL